MLLIKLIDSIVNLVECILYFVVYVVVFCCKSIIDGCKIAWTWRYVILTFGLMAGLFLGGLVGYCIRVEQVMGLR